MGESPHASSEAPRRLTVPDPQPGLRPVLVAAGLVGSAAALFSLSLPIAGDPLISVALLVGAAVLLLVPVVFQRRTLTLESDGTVVKGLRDGTTLPVGEGTISVRGYVLVKHKPAREGDFQTSSAPCFDVMHSSRVEPLQTHCSEEAVARAFAEGLCRVGRYELHWTPEGASQTEVRTPDELDLPLRERVRRHAHELPAPLPPARPRVAIAASPAGSVRVRWRPPGILALLQSWLIVAGAAVVGASLAWLIEGKLLAIAVLVGTATVGASLSVLWFTLRRMVGREVEVSTRTLRKAWRVFGVMRLSRFLDLDAIETIYIEQRSRFSVVIRAGRKALRLPVSSSEEGRYVRLLLLHALAGRPLDAKTASQSAAHAGK